MVEDFSYLRSRNKIVFVVLGVIILLVMLLVTFYNIIKKDEKNITLTTSKKEIAIRGSIYTNNVADSIKYGFQIAKSIQAFKATVDTRFIDKNKIDLFITLFSIYTNIEESTIREKFNSQKKLGQLVLSYNLDSRVAANLKQLQYKLNRLAVFIPIEKNSSFIIGLDVDISGDKRVYKYGDTLTPVIGFTRKYESKDNITRIKGINGLEKYYDEQLNNYENSLISGKKDVIGDIVFDKESSIKNRIDGKSLLLNIDLKLQKRIEYLLSHYKEKFQAKEIIVSVMDSTSGKILVFATSNRYNPKEILSHQISYLRINATQSAYEYGSVIKPIVMALLFDKNKVKRYELLNAYNKSTPNKKGYYKRGKFKIGRFTIGDDHHFKKRYITPEDTIVYSSNIGILQLAQRLQADEFKSGFENFGFGKKTNIDLPYEAKGKLHSLKQYRAYEKDGKDNIFKATDSYGQGFTSTFIQILSAYSVFNNNGKSVTPQIVSSILDIENDKNSILLTKEQKNIIQPKTAQIIKELLIKTVQKGTGVAAHIEGLEIGGKTGTSQIAKKGKYQKEYISSFFGFANDKENKYTIGVTVFEPSYKYHYASSSAAPIFKKVVESLVKNNYLHKSN